MERKESAKERILQVAWELFYQEGIRAVGIDRIIAESGVAKASFYRNFATKDDLVVAYLKQRHRIVLERIEEARTQHPNEPVAQLRFIFERVTSRMKLPDFRGCPFMNAAVEFPDTSHPGYITAVACREESWQLISQIARDTGARDPEALTAQLELLYSGVIMTAYMHRGAYNADHFYNAVLLLIKDQMS